MTVLDEALPDVPPLLLLHVTGTLALRAALSLLDDVPADVTPSTPRADWTVLALIDPAADRQEPPAATALLAPVGSGAIELRAFGIRAGLPLAVVADRLLAGTADWLRAAGWRTLVGPPPAHVRPELAPALVTAGFTGPETGGERQELCL